jgi:tetratricopeptide (TPR) repeat protein
MAYDPDAQIQAVRKVEGALGEIASSMSLDSRLIVISIDRVQDGLHHIAQQLSEVDSAVGALSVAIDLGFAEISYQLRLQSGQLDRILETLQAPLDTESKELRGRAQIAYANGWIDEAEEDFLKSLDANRYDFTVHQALGNIAWQHRDDVTSAASHYRSASKYARPVSRFDCALAELSLAALAEYRGEDADALKHARDALDVDPESPEAKYAVARYLVANSLVGADVAELLLEAFRGRLALCLLAPTDDILAGASHVVTESLCRLREELAQTAKNLLTEFQEAVVAAQSEPPDHQPRLVQEAKAEERRALAFVDSGTIVDLHIACSELPGKLSYIRGRLLK